MAHPEWALKYKEKNTELRCIRGRYYLYGYKTVYCPIKKRAKKVTTPCIGRITEEDGFIPSGTQIPTSFARAFSQLDDPRCQRLKMYTLVEILLVSFVSVICGGEGYGDMENFGRLKLPFLRQFYPFKNGTPSDDTFRRFFTKLNPEKFKEIFVQWVQSICRVARANIIAVDGKSSRGSHDKETQMLHTVSAYATNMKLVFGQEKVDEKSNEITAIPKLLELIDITGAVITIDAMGCQFLIADMIVRKKGDYSFCLKGNQGSLCDDVTLFLNDVETSVTTYTDYDKGHGRIETRICSVSTDVAWLHQKHPQWHTIKSLIKICSIREIEGRITSEDRFLISSREATAQEHLAINRSHWAVENNLHWVLDMTFNEDRSRIRKGHGPLIMTMMRHAALNLLQQAKSGRQSIKGLMKMCALDEQTLLHVVTQKIPS